MNNISNHQSLILDLKVFFSEHISESKEDEIVFLRYNRSDFKEFNGICSRLDQGGREKTIYIVLLESTAIGKLQKVAAIFWRTYAMLKITKCMRQAGLCHVSKYALFPNADTARIVYELATDASQYAEHQLIPQQKNRVFALLTHLASVVFGCSPRVDAVAIVGRK